MTNRPHQSGGVMQLPFFIISLKPTDKPTPTEELKLSLSSLWSIAYCKYERYSILFLSVVDNMKIASAILLHKTWPSKWYTRSCYFLFDVYKTNLLSSFCGRMFALHCPIRCIWSYLRKTQINDQRPVALWKIYCAFVKLWPTTMRHDLFNLAACTWARFSDFKKIVLRTNSFSRDGFGRSSQCSPAVQCFQ